MARYMFSFKYKLHTNYRIELAHHLKENAVEKHIKIGRFSLTSALAQDFASFFFWHFTDMTRFSQLLKRMNFTQTSDLVNILSNVSAYDLTDVAKNVDIDNSQDFMSYWKQHPLIRTHKGNSIIFNIEGNTPYILKIDNYPHRGKHAARYLREHSLRTVFSPIIIEKQCSHGPTILLTERYQLGDLYQHSLKLFSIDDKINHAIYFYQQMASILIKIQEDKCVFTDMKNRNWLIDDNGLLRIADTKSFELAHELSNGGHRSSQGWLTISHLDRIYHTVGTKPPEYTVGAFISIDKAHSYMLGKNIYHYLSANKLPSNKDDFNFDLPIFQHEQGQLLMNLIKNMIQRDPRDRMTVLDVLSHLTRMNPKNQLLIEQLHQTLSAAIDRLNAVYDHHRQHVIQSLTRQENIMDKVQKERLIGLSSMYKHCLASMHHAYNRLPQAHNSISDVLNRPTEWVKSIVEIPADELSRLIDGLDYATANETLSACLILAWLELKLCTFDPKKVPDSMKDNLLAQMDGAQGGFNVGPMDDFFLSQPPELVKTLLSTITLKAKQAKIAASASVPPVHDHSFFASAAAAGAPIDGAASQYSRIEP